MKKTTLIKTLCLSLIIVLMASCASNHFGSRKYTAGNYRQNHHKAPKVKVNEVVKDEAVYASSESKLSESDLKVKTPEFLNEEVKTTPSKKEALMAKLKAKKPTPFKEIKLQVAEFKKNKQLKKNGTFVKKPKAAKGNEGLDTTALLSLILSVCAIACDIIGFLLVLATLEYMFLILFAVGLGLAITGLIMGTKGLKNHRENKGSVLDLIFSIVGTALGGIAIILSVYYSVWCALWIALSA